jgi:hypothetical protein
MWSCSYEEINCTATWVDEFGVENFGTCDEMNCARNDPAWEEYCNGSDNSTDNDTDDDSSDDCIVCDEPTDCEYDMPDVDFCQQSVCTNTCTAET